MRRLAVIAVLAAGLADPPAPRAETVSYTIAVPPETPATYELPISVAHAGRVVIDATWSGARLLSFRLDPGAGVGSVVRRSGPSPQRIDVEVPSDRLSQGPAIWTLEIRALTARDGADGTVSVTVPDAPEVVAAREAAALPPPPPPPEPDPWAVARPTPPGASPLVTRLFARIEDLRQAVYADDPLTVRDSCGWQDDAVRWLAQRRDGLAAGEPPPSPESLAFFAQLAHAARAVEQMRTSTSSLIAGPVPETTLRRRAWLLARRDAIRPVERELDGLADGARRGSAPQIAGERWLTRLVACLTSSERYFEARVRTAPRPAEGAEIAEAQWPRILAAAEAFDALAAWADPPAAP